MLDTRIPERREEIDFRFEITDPELGLEAIRVFEMSPTIVNPGDTLKVNYKFWAEYFGGIVKKFEFIIRLMEAGIVVHPNMEEAKHKQILFKRLMELYFQITGELSGRDETLPFAESATGHEAVRGVGRELGVAVREESHPLPGPEEGNPGTHCCG